MCGSFTLPKKNAYFNAKPSNDVKVTLSNIPLIVVASYITDAELKLEYSKLNYDDINITKLKKFGHKRLTNPIKVDEVGINYNNQRQAARFI